ncbi:aminotransferase class V-fold PLP-dependent enzyme [Stieleria varia]|uniref:cysteine desulfurase n=1 Tax=Stieleria varia TaxID=2528005 RepID=A0A5C6B8Q1_9BACT|nr:aminotransferase class V-fold PLP-dependent enzyme [Stieleria varia]TWU08348.1 putative cysteine desulfurase [Stieleria varia]
MKDEHASETSGDADTNRGRRIYLDHAATSWPKPNQCIEAMIDFIRECGAASGRGAYANSVRATAIVDSLRREIARWLGVSSPRDISFHANGTAAINAALGGLLRVGDHVVTTGADHNSVLRPLHAMAGSSLIDWTIVDCDRSGRVSPDDVLAAVTDRTRMVAVTHAANVTGTVQPISEIGQRIADHPAIYFCDAAQTFGYLPINVREMGIDVLAAPGHKGALGPLGTGFLYLAEKLHSEIRPTILGGTGSASESLDMPSNYPDKLESGNLNVPALAGWLAAMRAMGSPDAQSVLKLKTIAARLHAGLRSIDTIDVMGDESSLPIASIVMQSLAPHDLASILDAEYGIETRSGFHCAARIHHALGSEDGGTLRISGGHGTTAEEIDALIAAIREISDQVNG